MTPTLRVACRFAAVIAVFLLSPYAVFAQDRPVAAVDLSAGWIGFADDGVVSEVPVGVGVRWYLSPRISIGPEVTFIAGKSHSHQVVTGNFTIDLLASRNNTPRVTPFVVVGAGLFRTSESFANRPRFSSTEGAFTVGGGVRAPLGRRVAIGADARLGWETHLRITGFVSAGLGGKP